VLGGATSPSSCSRLSAGELHIAYDLYERVVELCGWPRSQTCSMSPRAMGSTPQPRLLVVALLVAGLMVAFAPTAQANIETHDPDEGLPLDIDRVASEVKSRWRSPSPKVIFRVRFNGVADWDRRPLAQILLDTRRGPRVDLMIEISFSRIRGEECFLSDVEGRRLEELDYRDSTDSMGCKVKRSSLQSDGSAIRWRVVSLLRRDVEAGTWDEVPDVGFLPHA
jgi:hypothetical protein